MASFVIHHTAGLNFLKQLEEKYHVVLTEEQKKQFLLGNLIVDSTSLKFAIPDGVSQEELKLMKTLPFLEVLIKSFRLNTISDALTITNTTMKF